LPEHLSLKQVENGAAELMLRIGQNLSYVATKKKVRRIFQMANIFYYQVTGETQLSERSPRDLAPENYGAIYNGVLGHFLSQKEIPSTILISGHFVYNSEGHIFPAVPTLMHSSFVIPGVDTKLLQLTHVEDYVGALIHLMTTDADLPIVNVVDNLPIAQKQFFGIVGNILKQRQTLILPEAIVAVICGDLYTKSLQRTVTAKNDLLKSTGYWLKYPDYKAGFAKYIMSL
jgi:NAD dependent epimerase/dehydratase family enzyme